ncbi:non-ribosomal peptide synthetase [Cellulosilyticum ruminicola]|uniref:non-ribosomal peptide synthetase n=1 Tax=Cellulosilyticum ruminicola TaxID=425254 RepID=UPI0006D08CFF|nr:amino acid adenylation domain-containing protein [Cellulosilyticum ruminicola]
MEIHLNGNIIYNNRLYTTKMLEQYIQCISMQLDCYKIRKDEIIAIALERSPILIATLFSLLEKHIPFMLIDKLQAKERMQYMLINANINQVIIDEEGKFDFEGISAIRLDCSKLEEASCSKMKVNQNQSEICYLMYTSGSTGKPKGVEVLRKGIENFIEAVPQQIKFESRSKIACLTKTTFDIFFLESILALNKGLTVVLATEEEQQNPRKILELIEKNKVDMIQMTPSALQILYSVDNTFSALSEVRTIMVGGENLPESLLKNLQQYTKAKIYNMYGPTETTIWSAISDLTQANEVNIGHPILNTQIYILDEQMQQVEQGEVGEICIAGAGVSKGYCNNEEATAKQFIKVPFKENTLVYKTGDLGCYNSDGNLTYKGRIDQQIKLRGHRIELEEIENVLLEMQGINIAMTCYHPTAQGGEIIAFVAGNETIIQKEIISRLEMKLPSYMIPKKIIQVEQMKYTDNGKKDRVTMLETYLQDIPQENEAMQGNNLKKEENILGKIQEIFANKLNRMKTEFKREVLLTDLGIDSFTYIEIIIECETAFDIQFDEDALTYNAFQNLGEIEAAILERLEIANQ